MTIQNKQTDSLKKINDEYLSIIHCVQALMSLSPSEFMLPSKWILNGQQVETICDTKKQFFWIIRFIISSFVLRLLSIAYSFWFCWVWKNSGLTQLIQFRLWIEVRYVGPIHIYQKRESNQINSECIPNFSSSLKHLMWQMHCEVCSVLVRLMRWMLSVESLPIILNFKSVGLTYFDRFASCTMDYFVGGFSEWSPHRKAGNAFGVYVNWIRFRFVCSSLNSRQWQRRTWLGTNSFLRDFFSQCLRWWSSGIEECKTKLCECCRNKIKISSTRSNARSVHVCQLDIPCAQTHQTTTRTGVNNKRWIVN